ncbi:hypothetical protein VNO77_03887 [Canavalia gladiata]|uniref:Uncharacterized protein n=1 Tax=Canavalia gladiata TaxID=3824 RepID=A0AAN9RCN0_CANGL
MTNWSFSQALCLGVMSERICATILSQHVMATRAKRESLSWFLLNWVCLRANSPVQSPDAAVSSNNIQAL